MIKAGSYTRLENFETCAYQAKLRYIERIPEPDRGPPPKGKKEWANDRGSRLHDEAEQYVLGKIPELGLELQGFEPELTKLRALFSTSTVETEQTWVYDQDWGHFYTDDPFDERICFRIKTDVTVLITPEEGVVIDLKSGRRKPVQHQQQTQLYAIGAFLRYPKLELVTTELWYIDHANLEDQRIVSGTYTRRKALVLHKAWARRLEAMLTARVFPPRPSDFTCRWCPYNKRLGGGICDYAVV